MKNKGKIIGNIITFVILGAIIVFAWKIYQRGNFNEYVRAEYNIGLSEFTRDEVVKYDNSNSYRIESQVFNDAMFFKKIEVTPNTVYKVTCKIKALNVEAEDEHLDVGAHICIGDTFEKSNNVIGTSDWQEVTLLFNSKNRTSVDLGFRLGGAEGKAKGIAWFSDFKIESGITDTSNNWKFLCLIFDYVDVDINGQSIKLQLTATDREDIVSCMKRFKTSMEEMTSNKIEIDYGIIETKTPITHFSYDAETGYYVSGYDIKDVLDEYINEGVYDHVFVVFRTGNINNAHSVLTSDWIGLGSMEYRGLGYSNIRLPDDNKSYIYKYDARINTFPEEVLIHEFLHTLERNAEENGYERPALHDNSVYGYENKPLEGLKKWYQDYMNKNIKSSNGYIGLPEEIYTIKPAKANDFTYSHEIDELKEPQNIIEELNNVVKRIKSFFSGN